MQRLALFTLVALLVGGILGYWVGAGVESGRASKRELDQALAYADGWIRSVDAARTDAAAATRAEAAQIARRDQANAAVREVDHAAAALPPRPDCDWTADELRLARARHCARYPDDAACRVLGVVPAASAASESAASVGTADRGLGLRLSRTESSLRNVDAAPD